MTSTTSKVNHATQLLAEVAPRVDRTKPDTNDTDTGELF